MAHKLVRQRARPKILLCSDYEDAAQQAMEYRDNLLAVVSDVQFPRGGAANENAGFELAHMIRKPVPDVPIVLHSSHTEYRSRAHGEGFAFLQKRSPTFLRDFRRLLTQQCAFGDFVFRMPDGAEVARASDMNSLEAMLHTVPVESLGYHSEQKSFFALADSADGICGGAEVAAAESFGFRRSRGPAAGPDFVHQ